MAAPEIGEFLAGLAVKGKVSASTQSQALSAILFLYKNVLEVDPGWVEGLVRVNHPVRVPVVLTPGEVKAVLQRMAGPSRLVAHLLYGGGLRLLEALQLRIKDVDFGGNELTVRRGKGAKDRRTMLPAAIQGDLAVHLTEVREQYDADVAAGAGWVGLPGALHRKYPNAGREWIWQWVFPASRLYRDAETGQRRRHHFHETAAQRAVRAAARDAAIPKRVSRTRCGTRLQRTFCRPATTSGPSRSSSATAM